MKAVALLVLFSFSSHCLAMGDIERGIIFAGNALSGGTYLPELESQLNAIKLAHERRLVEIKLEMDLSYQSQLLQHLNEKITELKSAEQELQAILLDLREDQKAVDEIILLLTKAHKARLRLPELLSQLEQRAATMKRLQPNWNDLAIEGLLQMQDRDLSPNELQTLFQKVLDRKLELAILIGKFEGTLNLIKSDVETFETQLEGLTK